MVKPVLNPVSEAIVIKTCTDRGGHKYYHPFIGKYALSRKLIWLLRNEYFKEHVKGGDYSESLAGMVIPIEFYDKYTLLACEPPYDDIKDEEHDNCDGVTSDYWYSYNKPLFKLK